MNANNNHADKHSKKETIHASVESFIEKKQAEHASEGAQRVQSTAEGIQGNVADVMAGVEKPSEKISERKESRGDGDLKTKGGGKSDDTAVTDFHAQMGDIVFPDEEIMIKKIRTAITIQIKQEVKRAKRLEKGLATGSAHEYNESIARIRTLKEILASLIHNTVDALKGMYGKYFTAEGRRKRAEEG